MRRTTGVLVLVALAVLLTACAAGPNPEVGTPVAEGGGGSLGGGGASSGRR